MFLDEGGFLLIPNLVRTWAPRGETPVHYHSLQRDKISTIAALSVSPKRKHLALYLQFHRRNLNGLDVKAFLGELLKHLRGEIILLWDRSPIHIKRKEVSEFLRQHPRIHVEEIPRLCSGTQSRRVHLESNGSGIIQYRIPRFGGTAGPAF